MNIADDDIDDETKSSNSMYVISERMRYYIILLLNLNLKLRGSHFTIFLSVVNFCWATLDSIIGFGSTRVSIPNVYIFT